MFIFIFLAAFAAVHPVGWIIYALTHPVLAGQGILIFLCKAAGVIALLSALGFWMGPGFPQSSPSPAPVHGRILRRSQQARTALAQLVRL